MNVLQKPQADTLAASMDDYIIDTDVTIRFTVTYKGNAILDEEYVPDAQNQVRIRRLGKFCNMALWGIWPDGRQTWQQNAAGSFSFSFNQVLDSASHVLFCRALPQAKDNPPAFLSMVQRKITHEGCAEYLSVPSVADTSQIEFQAFDSNGLAKSTHIQLSGEYPNDCPLTMDTSLEYMRILMPDVDIVRYSVVSNGQTFEYLVDPTRYVRLWQFRYKNIYDMPETLTAKGLLSIEASDESDQADLFGVTRKFGVRVTDEYTVNSGSILLQSDYRLWRDLLHACEVQIKVDDEWLPIVITNMKYERDFRKSVMKTVEFSFKMADNNHYNLIDL